MLLKFVNLIFFQRAIYCVGLRFLLWFCPIEIILSINFIYLLGYPFVSSDCPDRWINGIVMAYILGQVVCYASRWVWPLWSTSHKRRTQKWGCRHCHSTNTMTSADLRWLRTAAWGTPSNATLHILSQHVPQDVYVVKFILFHLYYSLWDTFTALAAISPLVSHHEGIVHCACHSQW
jgi:hypothetical protein